MPLSIKTAEESFNVRPSISQFVFPHGATINMNGIALIMGVDRILDMSRTAINVTGDLVACRLMEKWVGGMGTAEEQIALQKERDTRNNQELTDVVVDGSDIQHKPVG